MCGMCATHGDSFPGGSAASARLTHSSAVRAQAASRNLGRTSAWLPRQRKWTPADRATAGNGDANSAGDGELLFQLLLLVEAGVVAVEREQFIVPAHFHNSAVVEHGDLVGIAHGRDAMGDQNRRCASRCSCAVRPECALRCRCPRWQARRRG